MNIKVLFLTVIIIFLFLYFIISVVGMSSLQCLDKPIYVLLKGKTKLACTPQNYWYIA